MAHRNSELRQSLDEREERSLVVVLRPLLTLAWIRGHPKDALELEGELYCDAGCGEWTGFYDWLRGSRQALIGVRYWPDDDSSFLLPLLRSLPYAYVPTSGHYAELYFSRTRRFDDRQSADQAFRYNKVFRSEGGTYLIAFEDSKLTIRQVGRLLVNSDATWLAPPD